MRIRTARDLGALIRDRRRLQSLDQASLAKRVGVSRQWIIEVEKGKPRAELGLVLRTLAALGVALAPVDSPSATTSKRGAAVDIDAIVDAARRRDR